MAGFRKDSCVQSLSGLKSRRALLRAASGGALAASLPLFGASRVSATQEAGASDVDVANVAAQAISRLDDPSNPKNGKLKLHDPLLSGLDKEAAKVVRKFVDDINKKKIGLAYFPDETTVMLYGSELALDRGAGPESAQEPAATKRPQTGRAMPGPAVTIFTHRSQSIADSLITDRVGSAELLPVSALAASNGAWVDWWGVHFYLDSWWTARLWELSGWAVGAIAGALVSLLCSTGLACLAAGAVVSFVWEFIVWRIIKPMGPHDLIIHCPWWGWVHVQPRRSGQWYHNMWFRSWLWT